MKIFIVFLILLISVEVYAFENLVSGVGITIDNEDSLRSTSLPYAIARQGQRAANNKELVQGYFETDSNVYSISSEPTLIQTKKEGRLLIGNWPLTSLAICDDCEESWWIGRWNDQEFLEPLIKERFHYNSGGEIQIMGDGLGCLNKTPLRYGDIDDDSKNELVLFLNDNLLIFNPELTKTVFLMLYNLDDFTSAEDTIIQHGFEKPEFPQYVSNLATNSGTAFQVSSQVTEPALQAFSKLYTVDVDNDQIKDLIVWRKLYHSRLQSDAVKGFEKISDTYLHYSKVEGEYHLQIDTAPETIQGWLGSSNLTWQKGFPSKSECVGQEGQLIPEMHDALLNDPDVLK